MSARWRWITATRSVVAVACWVQVGIVLTTAAAVLWWQHKQPAGYLIATREDFLYVHGVDCMG